MKLYLCYLADEVQKQPRVQGAAQEYLRFPAGVDSALFIAVDGFPFCDFGKEAERATSLDFTISTSYPTSPFALSEISAWGRAV